MLAISSGGDHSAYVLGMLKGVFTKKPELTEWSKVSGISAGALIGSTICGIDKEDRTSFLKNINHLMNSHLSFSHKWTPLGEIANIVKAFVWHESLYKKPMQEIIKNEWSGNFKRDLYVGAYNESKGRYESFGPKPSLNHVAASASVPVVFKSVLINKMEYVDGGVSHVIPVKEIKEHWKSGHLDLMLCYPTNHEEFLKTSNFESRFKLMGAAWNTLSESTWITYNADLDDLTEMVGQDIRSGGTFTTGNKTLRVYIPKKGYYCDFMNRDFQTLKKMHQHGEKIANELLS